ncbi:MAG: hypothetical protein ABSC56_10315 [Solirubrobacteraceae bacterium]
MEKIDAQQHNRGAPRALDGVALTPALVTGSDSRGDGASRSVLAWHDRYGVAV